METYTDEPMMRGMKKAAMPMLAMILWWGLQLIAKVLACEMRTGTCLRPIGHFQSPVFHVLLC